MKVLIDTNILIAAEPTSIDDIEPMTEQTALLIGIIQQNKYNIFWHPASLSDLRRDKNTERKDARITLLKKYNELRRPPIITNEIKQIINIPIKNNHDYVDLNLLAAVYGDAVDYLVTEDRNIHTKAQRLGIQYRVLTADAMIRMIRGLSPKDIESPPAVEHIKCYELDETDEIFNSFKRDYPEFGTWLKRCKREHRDAWLIKRPDQKYAGISIIKNEEQNQYGFTNPLLKICSFKVADIMIGRGYSELLLKTALEFAFHKGYKQTYVEVMPKYGSLIYFFNMFGFYNSGRMTQSTEMVLVKDLSYTMDDYEKLEPIEFHIRFGPKYFKVDNVLCFIIPIQPRFHNLLFPEIQTQLELMPGRYTFGNAMRKAYICNSPTKEIPRGSIILFYRSKDQKSIQCIGIVEKSIRSCEPHDIERFVGPRTVYTSDEIIDLCKDEVLAINFRCAQPLSLPLDLKELISSSVISGPPQSIIKIKEEGWEWLRTRLIR